MFKFKKTFLLISILVLAITLLPTAPVMAEDDSAELVKDYFFKLSVEQIELRNDLIQANTGISEGRILEQVAPEAKKYLPAEAIMRLHGLRAQPSDPKEPFVYLYSKYGPLPPVFSGKREIQCDEKGIPSYGEFSINRSEWPSILSTGTTYPSASDSAGFIISIPYWPWSYWYKIGDLVTNGSFSWDSGAGTVQVNYANASSWADASSYWYCLFSQPPIGYPGNGWWTIQYYQKREYPGGPIQTEYSMRIDITGYSNGSWYLDYTEAGNTAGKTFVHAPGEGWH